MFSIFEDSHATMILAIMTLLWRLDVFEFSVLIIGRCMLIMWMCFEKGSWCLVECQKNNIKNFPSSDKRKGGFQNFSALLIARIFPIFNKNLKKLANKGLNSLASSSTAPVDVNDNWTVSKEGFPEHMYRKFSNPLFWVFPLTHFLPKHKATWPIKFYIIR